MTRVLILSQYYYPEGPIPTSLAEGLAARGYQVEVLTAFPHYREGRIYGGYRQRLWLREEINGIPVVRVPLYPSHDQSAVRRTLTYASFATSAATLGRSLVHRPDVIYVYVPPVTAGLSAFAVRALRGHIPVLLHVQDLWPEGVGVRKMASGTGLIPLIRALARLTYRRSDRVMTISPGFKRVIASYGVAPDRIEVVYNWCQSEAEAMSPIDTAGNHTQGPGNGEAFTVVYAGNMGPAQDLSTVMDAAVLLHQAQRSVRFLMIGDGIERAKLMRRKEQEALSSVQLLPPCSFSEVARITAGCDATLVHLAADPVCHMWIPSKLQASLALGKPVLLGVEGDAACLLGESKAGIPFRPGDPQSLADSVLKLMSMTPQDRTAMGSRGREYYLQHLAFDRTCDRVARIIDDMIISHGTADGQERTDA